MLFSAGAIQAFLAQSGLTNDPAGLDAFPHWNGRDFDFYFGPGNSLRGVKYPNAYLLKADRAGPSLKLMYAISVFVRTANWTAREHIIFTQAKTKRRIPTPMARFIWRI